MTSYFLVLRPASFEDRVRSSCSGRQVELNATFSLKMKHELSLEPAPLLNNRMYDFVNSSKYDENISSSDPFYFSFINKGEEKYLNTVVPRHPGVLTYEHFEIRAVERALLVKKKHYELEETGRASELFNDM